MSKALTAAEVEKFKADGFLPPFPVMDAVRAANLRASLERFEADHGGPLKGPYRFKSHLLFKWLADLVRDPAVLDPVEDLIGPNIMSFPRTLARPSPRAIAPLSSGARTASVISSTSRSRRPTSIRSPSLSIGGRTRSGGGSFSRVPGGTATEPDCRTPRGGNPLGVPGHAGYR